MNLVPWFIFLLILLTARKRDSRSLGVLFPLLLPLIWFSIIIGFLPKELRHYITRVSIALFLSQAVFWLVLERFARSNRVTGFLKCLGLMAALGLILFLNWDSPNPQEQKILMTFYLLSIVNLLVGFTLARLIVRDHFTPFRFVILLPFINILFLIPLFLLFYLVMYLFAGVSTSQNFVFKLIVLCTVMGLIIFAASLPYLLLVFNNGYFREVFYRIFRIPVAPPPDTQKRFEDLTQI